MMLSIRRMAEAETNSVVKARTDDIQVVQIKVASIVANHTHGKIVLHMGKSAKNVAKITILRLYVGTMLILIKWIQAAPDPTKARVRAKSSRKWLEITMR